MKRLWLIALVVVLALSLTSCSRKRSRSLQEGYGFGYCDGTAGSFDLYVIRSPSAPGYFDISLIPVEVVDGDIMSLTVANQELDYKTLVMEIALRTEREVNVGRLTEAELDLYTIFAITPYQPGIDFLNVVPDKDAVCVLPKPDNGFDENTPK